MIEHNLTILIGLATFAMYCLAAWAIVHAIQARRSPQSAVAWTIALMAMPVVALPAYLVFGRNKFHAYVEAHRSVFAETSSVAEDLNRQFASYATTLPDSLAPLHTTVASLTSMRFTRGNAAELLVDGERTYGAMLQAMTAATDYILLQSYIVRDDAIGGRFRDVLVARAQAGVKVYFLYDAIGSVRLPERYVAKLRAGGVIVAEFKTTRGPGLRWQINFRNHRKILVVDGRCAFVGGLNIGDEYLGRNKKIGPWRDTHVKLTGPAVQMAQMGFLEDWYWSERAVPELCWEPETAGANGSSAAVVHTGPADENSVCQLMHVQAFNAARERIWVAAGYFVPDEPVVCALQLAALRGVDVRVLIPARTDTRLARLASFAYLPRLLKTGVKVFHYLPGVMHQKVFLIDGELAGIGSANLDNRSLHINFEITAMIADPAFAETVEQMLLDDFTRSRQFDQADFDAEPYLFRLTTRAVNLIAPLL